jgi:hypothetical protein
VPKPLRNRGPGDSNSIEGVAENSELVPGVCADASCGRISQKAKKTAVKLKISASIGQNR